jgi:hypothetical protein
MKFEKLGEEPDLKDRSNTEELDQNKMTIGSILLYILIIGAVIGLMGFGLWVMYEAIA